MLRERLPDNFIRKGNGGHHLDGHHRRPGKPGPDSRPAGTFRSVSIDEIRYGDLRWLAARRDMPVGRLVRDLLDVIVADGLVSALLDL
jgi:hypothetical protein